VLYIYVSVIIVDFKWFLIPSLPIYGHSVSPALCGQPTSLDILLHHGQYHEFYTSFTSCQLYGFKYDEYPRIMSYVRPLSVWVHTYHCNNHKINLYL
jgi:hypothetical protein